MQLSEAQLITRLKSRSLRYHVSTDTTNDDALAWLHEGASAGSVVIVLIPVGYGFWRMNRGK